MTNDELLHKWINGTISEEELKAFKQRPEYDSLVELYKNTDGFSAPDFDREQMLSEILEAEKTQEGERSSEPPIPPVGKKRLLIPAWIKYGIAASILIFAGWFFLFNSGDEITNKLAKGERLDELLPDGSFFVLNAESTLKYNAENWSKDRSMQLKGEAFFDVQEGSTFRVNTPSGSIEVLGTKFNVWSRKGVLEVMCLSGKVKVIFEKGKQAEELTQNQAIRISPNKAPLRWYFPTSEKPGWVKGISSFKNVTVSRVIEELERQFDIEIDAKKINTSEVISANFPHQDLETALRTALGSLKIKYEIRDEKKVYLYQ